MPSWKILTGRTLSFYAANESSTDSINAAIKRHLDLGWILKGPMTRVQSSEIWTQIMVLPRK
jgi:hypothetical protein